MKRRTPILLVLIATLARADDVILHEYVPNAGDEELDAVLGPGGEPAAIVYDDTILTAPEGGARRNDERAMSAMPGDGSGREEAGRRSPTFRPDRVTSLEGTLGYFEVFTPAVAPFKRVSALDAVVSFDDGTPVLGVSSQRTDRVPVEGALATPPDSRERERFWGSVVLDFRAGAMVPLPSISPESRMLTLRTERLDGTGEEVDLEIHRDGAGSYFAVAPPGVRTEVRVVFLTDAPKDYFRMAELPDEPSDQFADEVFALEDAVRDDALLFARELGLSPGQSYRRTLPILVEHFRSFVESDEPPPSTGNIFLDLARGMKGVCRHRAYPFVIVAQALGIPAHFVQNEAHAWVEVKIPQQGVPGWLRIDLGGAAAGLEAHNAQDRPMHRPTGEDVLPRPEPYVRSYSQLSGNVRGLRRDGPTATPAPTTPDTSAPTPGATVAQTPSEGSSDTTRDPLAALFSPTEPTTPTARPLRLTVEGREFEVLRGRQLELSGRALDPDGAGVAGLRVEVVARGAIERLLGVTVTREGGNWQASVGVPPELPVGDYALVVRTPGSDRFFPATAR
ncbi:MAG: hypothetical protein H6722_04620 [Sandaracinus sp.]|nr:hypothetical protein [Myxococcales bacterium]MCB9611720.1 hypothetical protein [Sandaracinus sp.]MCB9620133.1 hypothetical protein [Sandaracinus sp.]